MIHRRLSHCDLEFLASSKDVFFSLLFFVVSRAHHHHHAQSHAAANKMQIKRIVQKENFSCIIGSVMLEKKVDLAARWHCHHPAARIRHHAGIRIEDFFFEIIDLISV